MKLSDLNARDRQFIGSILYAIAQNPVLANTISMAMNMEVRSFDEQSEVMFAELYPAERNDSQRSDYALPAGFN